MKCPKCGYLGFDAGTRCRNCGYEFSLSAPPPPPSPASDLSLRLDDEGPLVDFALSTPIPADESQPNAVTPRPERAASRRARLADRVDRAGDTVVDLPLFSVDAAPDQVTFRPSAMPRQPLGVRRATPDVLRAKPRPTPAVTPPAVSAPASSDATIAQQAAPAAAIAPKAAAAVALTPAGIWARLTASVLDAAILLAIDGAVLYFTLRLCQLSADQIGELPPAPLLAFLLMLNGGYVVGFTAASGQTIGKMAAGVQVVQASGVPVEFGHALIRWFGSLLCAAPVGLGFLSILFSRERRGWHDRLAGASVVKVSS